MDFVAVVDQAIALLRQRGRLTYRTLQLQFQLDDTHLEILKDELIYGQRLAIDEEGRILVWTGDPAMPESPAAPASVPAPPPAATVPPDAERRQLTVMFCDLVDSTNSPPNSIPKSTGMWCVRISRCVPKLSSATMGISPNCSVTVCSSISAIHRHMKMTHSEQYVRG